MVNISKLQILGAIALGATLALPVYAAQSPTPTSVDESSPDKSAKGAKGAKGGTGATAAGGTPTMPGKGPSSANESAPQKTGREANAPLQNDNKNMPNPKTPASVSESAPGKSGMAGTGDKAYGKKTEAREKAKEGAPR